MKKTLISAISIFVFLFLIKFCVSNYSMINFIKNELHYIVKLALTTLVFGIAIFAIKERQKNLEWQEKLRDKKREERTKRDEAEPYESFF